jgi:hypothetical protein
LEEHWASTADSTLGELQSHALNHPSELAIADPPLSVDDRFTFRIAFD